MPSSDIPLELWLRIANCIPPHMLKNLMSVNQAFFYAEMEERYKEVGLFQVNERMLKIVDRLEVPLVRNCVRVLRIRPYFIQQLLPTPDEDGCSSASPDLQGVLSSLKHSLTSLQNLTEYNLVWFELPFIGDIPVDILRAPMLGSGSRLQKLFIEASLDKLGLLLGQGTNSEETPLLLPELNELVVVVRRDCVGDGNGVATTATTHLLSKLASFINRHHSSIRRFSFSSTHAMDYAPFFQSLQTSSLLLLHLNDLFLSIPTAQPHLGLGSPLVIARWLNTRCPSLHTLTLKPHFIDDGHSEWQLSFEKWIMSLTSNLVLSELRSLRLSSGFFHPDMISFIVRHFAVTRTPLASLDVTGRNMTFAQVASLLQSLSSPGSVSASKLRALRLGPVTLSPELVDLLAEMVPELEELELRIKDVVPCKDDNVLSPVYTYTSSRKSRSQCREQIDQFSTEMHSRTYPQWTNLKRVSVWKFNSKMQYQAEYVELFGECVPALKRELEKGRRKRSQDGGGGVSPAHPQQFTSAGVSVNHGVRAPETLR